jgi:hypothetical protein
MKTLIKALSPISLSRRLAVGLLLLLPPLLLCPARRAQAQLLFTLDNPVQAGLPGQTLTFSGTLTNSGTSEIFLNGDNFSLGGTGLTLDDTPFVDGAPFSLAANESFSGSLFTVAIDSSAPFPQSGAGTFSIVGGVDDTAQDILASAPFQIGVTAPEPGALGLSMAGVAVLGILTARRRKA